MNYFIFIWFPYIAVLITFISAFNKYRYNVNQTSVELSTAELNFFVRGIPLFYWGLGLLLLGHLIGFIFPSYILIWNAKAFRLMLIELGAFGLGLAALISLFIFIINGIKKGFQKYKLSLWDILVFILLILIIVSGLWTANFYKWGSSWYAAIMTPYLRSLLVFSPDISAVEYMPASVKLHVFATFSFIGIITFSSFEEYITFPVRYILVKARISILAFILVVAIFATGAFALYFGKSYEARKTNTKIHLLTKDNQEIDLEKEHLK